VIDACHEFVDRFPESKFRKEVESYITQSQTNIKNLNSNT
jgi:outer membrane protein assembly factor BamD